MKKTFVIFAALALAAAADSAGRNSGGRGALSFPGSDGNGPGLMKDAYIDVRVDLADMPPVNAVHVDLKYDPAGLEYVGWTDGDLYSDPLGFGPFDRTEKGVVDVTVASLDGPRNGSGASAGTARFKVRDPGRAGVSISSLETGDGAWELDTQIDLDRGVGTAPRTTGLIGNTPNPFNPTTVIRYRLAETASVSLQVIDVSGRVVRTLVDGARPAGENEVVWNGMNDAGQVVSSGVYFSRLLSNGESSIRKMALIR